MIGTLQRYVVSMQATATYVLSSTTSWGPSGNGPVIVEKPSVDESTNSVQIRVHLSIVRNDRNRKYSSPPKFGFAIVRADDLQCTLPPCSLLMPVCPCVLQGYVDAVTVRAKRNV